MNRLVKSNNSYPVDSVDFFNSMFDEAFGNFFSPFRNSNLHSLKSDYFIEDNEAVINVDVAGSTGDNVDVQYNKDQNMVVIKVAKQYEKKESKPSFYVRERTISEQSRSFKLPENVDPATFTADVKNGLLSIRVKIGVKDKPESIIPIKVNS